MTTPTALESLRRVAIELGPELRDRVVFLGGCVAGLLVTEQRGYEPRLTDDVDVVADVQGRAGYYALQRQLKERGFREDPESRVLCRFRRGDLLLDLMPADPTILGFSNLWYDYAIESARRIELAPTRSDSTPVRIRVVSASCFVATKLEAYLDRGGDDYHEDIEDIVTVIDGRPDLLTELSKEREDLREYVRSTMKRLLDAGLEERISGLMSPDQSSQARVPLVVSTCRRIARLGGPPDTSALPPAFTFVWTLQFREGSLSGFYVNCLLEAGHHALRPFFQGNRSPIQNEALPDTVKGAAEIIWSVARPVILAHGDVDQEAPFRRATDHLVREIQSSGSPATALRLSWRREIDVPDGSVASPNRIVAMGAEVAGVLHGIVAIDAEFAEILHALDAEAARLATERTLEALAAQRAWKEG